MTKLSGWLRYCEQSSLKKGPMSNAETETVMKPLKKSLQTGLSFTDSPYV